jgi:DNA-binding transcriptional regulator YdaS (Cro superfamily)
MQTLFQSHGDISSLAEKLGINRASVHGWINRGFVPVGRCAEVERITGVRAEELNTRVKWFRVVEPGWPNGKPVPDLSTTPAKITAGGAA